MGGEIDQFEGGREESSPMNVEATTVSPFPDDFNTSKGKHDTPSLPPGRVEVGAAKASPERILGEFNVASHLMKTERVPNAELLCSFVQDIREVKEMVNACLDVPTHGKTKKKSPAEYYPHRAEISR